MSSADLSTPLDENLNSSQAAHGMEHEEEDHRMFGFIVFLLSESIIFFSFFIGYIVFKTSALGTGYLLVLKD